MEVENNIMQVFSGESRNTEQQLRDENELLKCQVENLEKEKQQLLDDISYAIEIGTVCYLCSLKDSCAGPAPVDQGDGFDYGDVCPPGAHPEWIGMPEDADESIPD